MFELHHIYSPFEGKISNQIIQVKSDGSMNTVKTWENILKYHIIHYKLRAISEGKFTIKRIKYKGVK